jgi:hypothetical protein
MRIMLGPFPLCGTSTVSTNPSGAATLCNPLVAHPQATMPTNNTPTTRYIRLISLSIIVSGFIALCVIAGAGSHIIVWCSCIARVSHCGFTALLNLHVPPHQAITLRCWPYVRLSGQEKGQWDDIFGAFDPFAIECRDILSSMAADACAYESRVTG